MAVGCVLAVLAIAPLLMFHTSTASSDAQSQSLPPSKAPHTAQKTPPSSQEKQARVLSALDAAALNDPPVVIHPATTAPALPVQPPATANALLGGGAQAPAAVSAGVVREPELAPLPAEPEVAPLPVVGVPELEPPAPPPASKPVPAPAPAPEIPAVVIAHSDHSEGDAAHSAHGHPPPSDRGDKPADIGAPEHGATKDADQDSEGKGSENALRSGGEKATHEGSEKATHEGLLLLPIHCSRA